MHWFAAQVFINRAGCAPEMVSTTWSRLGCVDRRELTCGFAVLGLAQVAQGTFVVAEVIEGDPCPVHGLEVVPLMAQHLQAVLLHPLIVDQL